MVKLSQLSKQHLSMLQKESGITENVIQARGYKTISETAEGRAALAEMGFAPRQRKVPGLLIPLFTTDGQNGLYIYRPDNPRVVENRRKKNSDGSHPQKVIKYEQPKGEPVRVDCHPLCQPQLADPNIPLFITEGQKKADALISRGACAIALTGVWNWKSRNKYGGTTFTNDLDYIAWENRKVYIVFDSDVFTKSGVRQALERFTEHLQRKKAHIIHIDLPSLDSGKTGIDDWFVAHPDKGLDDLISLSKGPRPVLKAAPPLVELLEHAPAMIKRPLALIDGRAYAATWAWVQVTVTETANKKGEIVRHDPPIVTKEERPFIIRDDGIVFGNGGDESIDELKLIVKLPEVVQQSKRFSTKGLKAYREGQRANPTDVFRRICECVDRFIDFDKSLACQQVMVEMIACYIMATWFLDAFTVAGFLWPNGDRGSGKTQLLIVISELAFLGQLILAGGSFAALRDMADYGATLAFDDAENLSDPRKTDPDKRTLLLAGNRRGNTVPLKEKDGDKGWRTRYVNTYCFRLFSAIKMPDNVLASRTIIVPLIRTPDRYRANADPLEQSLWPHDKRQLIDDLWRLALEYLTELSTYEKSVNQDARLTGRNLEPWRALLAVARWLEVHGVEGLWQRLEQLSVDYQKERPNMEISDLTALAIRALCQALGTKIQAEREVSEVETVSEVYREKHFYLTATLTDKAQAIVESLELDFNADYVTSRRLGRTLGKMRLIKGRQSGTGKSGWQASLADMERWTVSYGLNLSELTGLSFTTQKSEFTNFTNPTNFTPNEDELAGGKL